MPAVLAFDFASPTASFALADSGEILASAATPPGDERELLRGLDGLLTAARIEPRELAGVAAVVGPGSFTGVRIACATALGLAQAWGLPAGGVSTLEALAWGADDAAETVLAAVDALRGEWFVQRFGRHATDGAQAPVEVPAIWRPGDAPPDAGAAVHAFDAARFAKETGFAGAAVEAAPLAATVARRASRPGWRWQPERLTRPSYLRAPAVSRPAP